MEIESWPASSSSRSQRWSNGILEYWSIAQSHYSTTPPLHYSNLMTIRGSCLCGGIRFEVTPPFVRASHCHCERCRKHSGTAVCTQARVPKEQFRLLQGNELIQVYGKGEGAVKAFCRTCGSSMFGGDWPDGPEVSIRMGAFDDDPGIRPQFHTFVSDRASWDTITDDLPQHATGWSPT